MKSKSIIVFVIVFLSVIRADSFERQVMIKLVDRETGMPVAGAKMFTDYSAVDTSFAITPQSSSAQTNFAGVAVLTIYIAYVNIPEKAHEKYYEPIVWVVTPDAAYESKQKFRAHLAAKVRERDENFVPVIPDQVFEIESIQSKQKRLLKRKVERKTLEEEADRILKEQPSFWPAHDKAGNIRDMLGSLIVSKRWQAAKNSGVKNDADVDEINLIIKQRCDRYPNLLISNVVFPDANTAMANVSWYQSPLASAGYTYILLRIEGTWEIIRTYLEYVS